jgi:teichuronic acid exporter
LNFNLKNNILKGSIWLMGTNITSMFVRLLSTSILARLIEPEVFGVFALLQLIIVFPINIISSHLSNNLILLQNEKGSLINSIFIAFFYSLIFVLVLLFLLPEISTFFNEPKLEYLLKEFLYLPLILIANSIIDAFFSKNLQFKKIAIRNFFALLFSTTVTLVMSFYGHGIIALMYGLVFSELLKFLLLIINVRFDSIKIDFKVIKLLYNNALSITGTRLFFHSVTNLDKILISKYLNLTELGFYSKATQISQLPINLIANPLQKVGFSALSKVKDDKAFLLVSMTNTINILLKVIFPISLLLYAFSELIVNIILGSSWDKSIIILKIMSFLMFFKFVLKLFTTLLAVFEKFNLVLFVQVSNTILILITFLIFFDKGINGVAISLLLSSFLSCIIGLVICIFVMKGTFIDVFTVVKNTILISLILLLIVVGLDYYAEGHHKNLNLIIQTLIITPVLIKNIFSIKNKLSN